MLNVHNLLTDGEGKAMKNLRVVVRPLAMLTLLLGGIAGSQLTTAAPTEATQGKLAPGQTQQVLALRPLIDMAEGIAIDRRGHIFLSNRRLENDRRVCEILEVSLDGTTTVFATLDAAVEDRFDRGIVGLAFDVRGDLYAALISFNPETHGVWRIRRNGEAKRLAGSRNMVFPNALTFDTRGNLYVSDSSGSIWRFPPNDRGRLWFRNVLLAPDPGIGANGVVFVPPRNLYVANTDRALIARIRIRPDGTAGLSEVVASGLELLTIDGLAVDPHGTLYGVVAASIAFGTSPLVRVDPESGEITSATRTPEAFDIPTSLAFGRGRLDHRSVFVVNSGIFPEGRPEAAPGVVRVGISAVGHFPSANPGAVASGSTDSL